MTAPGLEADGAPAAPAEGAEAVRAAVAASRRGDRSGSWSVRTGTCWASVNAMYARKIAEIGDPGERATYVGARLAEQRADINLLRLASELVVDAVVEPADLRAELIARLAEAEHWTRGPQRRHHHISPV